jgi:hypothetical protein
MNLTVCTDLRLLTNEYSYHCNFCLYVWLLLQGFGISESSGVAVAMFILHVSTLTVLCLAASVYACFETATFQVL